MCGITAAFHFKGHAIQGQFDAFNRALSHRGPDAQHTFYTNGGQLALGHCRLSIIDLTSAADQPMSKYQGRYWLSFNGEIYNYPELRQELAAMGESFDTQSDTEVILAAYHVWGDACFRRFNGMWSIALWDDKKQALLLCRDRFGVKPLYFAEFQQGIYASSEQKNFSVLSPSFATIDPQRAATTIFNPPCIEGMRDSIYQGVKRLFPGELAWIRDTGIQFHRYWDTYDEIVESAHSCVDETALEQCFEQACRLRMRADVPITTTLSGGLDSSAVTAKLAQLSPSRFTAYTGRFPDTPYDESPYAQAVARASDIDLKIVNIASEDAVRDVVASTLSVEDISFSPPIGQWQLYRYMRQQGVKVALEGHAGDELFGGYPAHVTARIGDLLNQRQDPIELAQTIQLLSQQRALLGSHPLDLRGAILQSNSPFRSVNNRASYLQGVLPQVEMPVLPTLARLSQGALANESQLFKKLYLDFHEMTLPSILRNYDRLSMANSIELRAPFLDYRFVLAAFRASDRLRIHGGENKAILRKHFTFVPDAVRHRKAKSGFSPPMTQWLSEGLGSWLMDMIRSQHFQQSGLFDGQQVSQLLEGLLDKHQYAKVFQYWPIISLHILSQRGAR